MTSEEKQETKEKIMNAASELFSLHGFGGTSIREIASKSQVNVAAINYHFGSKHNLYWATIDQKQKWLEEGIRQISEEAKDVPDLTVKVYKFLMQDQAAVRSTMKMMLTEGVPEPEGVLRDAMHENYGPPGSQYFLKILRKETHPNISEASLMWGVKCVFSAIFHWATMSSSCKIELIKQKHPELNEEGIEKTLYHHSLAILSYLKSDPDLGFDGP